MLMTRLRRMTSKEAEGTAVELQQIREGCDVRFTEESTSTGPQVTSLVVQWLRLCTCTARDPGSTPDQGTRIPQAEAKNKTKQN